jgi:hypothetical protein
MSAGVGGPGPSRENKRRKRSLPDEVNLPGGFVEDARYGAAERDFLTDVIPRIRAGRGKWNNQDREQEAGQQPRDQWVELMKRLCLMDSLLSRVMKAAGTVVVEKCASSWSAHR